MSVNSGLFRHEESVLILIDYQPEMFDQVRSEPSENLIDLNVRLLISAAKAFDMPIILSTVGVKLGVNHPTKKSIRSAVPDAVPEIDRSTMDAWEDEAFRKAVISTGRKRLIFGALWTEICLAFPVLEAMKAGYDVTFVVDAIGGRSQLSHETAIQRLAHAGAVPNTAMALVAELFRDWHSPQGDKAKDVIIPYYKELGVENLETQSLKQPPAPVSVPVTQPGIPPASPFRTKTFSTNRVAPKPAAVGASTETLFGDLAAPAPRIEKSTESFAEIFFGNCTTLGIPCVIAAPQDIQVLCAKRDEAQLPTTFVDYDEAPREYFLNAVSTIVVARTSTPILPIPK